MQREFVVFFRSGKAERCSAGVSLFALSLLALMTLNEYASAAEEPLGIKEVKSELLKASLDGTKNTQPVDQDRKITETDLARAEKRLLAAEQRLLQKASLSNVAMQQAPQLPINSLAQKDIATDKAAESEKSQIVSEKNLPLTAPKASVDLRKFQGEVIGEERNAPVKSESVSHTIKQQIAGSAATGTAPVNPEIEKLLHLNSELQKQLRDASDKATKLTRELDENRNRLMIAETQVERLSAIIESRQGSVPTTNRAAVNSKKMAKTGFMEDSEDLFQDDMARDAQVATVVADKVFLRTGAGKENSPLMAVTKGTRLVVETRNGEWYRVIAPTGARAWISSDVVAFGLTARSSINQTSRVKGFDTGLE